MKQFINWSGFAILTGGVLTIMINVGLTPLLNSENSFAENASSQLFIWRQGLSALSGFLFLFGSVGLYLNQINKVNLFGSIAFLLSFLGSSFLLSHEWSQVFFVRELAIEAPDTLMKIDSAKGLGISDIGAMIAISVFSLGWILFSISMLMAKVYKRNGPNLVIAGFFLIPLLSFIIPNLWGAITGSVILGFGMVLLGRELILTKVTDF